MTTISFPFSHFAFFFSHFIFILFGSSFLLFRRMLYSTFFFLRMPFGVKARIIIIVGMCWFTLIFVVFHFRFSFVFNVNVDDPMCVWVCVFCVFFFFWCFFFVRLRSVDWNKFWFRYFEEWKKTRNRKIFVNQMKWNKKKANWEKKKIKKKNRILNEKSHPKRETTFAKYDSECAVLSLIVSNVIDNSKWNERKYEKMENVTILSSSNAIMISFSIECVNRWRRWINYIRI